MKQHDQVVTLITLTQASVHKDVPIEYFEKVMKGVANNARDAFLAIAEAPNQDIELRVSGEVRSFAAVKVKREMYDDWVYPWLAKQGYALHWIHAREVVKPKAQVFVDYLSNHDVAHDRLPTKFLEALPNYGELRQGKLSSELQYEYRWHIDELYSIFALSLHDASLGIIAISHDPSSESAIEGLASFATRHSSGIYRIAI